MPSQDISSFLNIANIYIIGPKSYNLVDMHTDCNNSANFILTPLSIHI